MPPKKRTFLTLQERREIASDEQRTKRLSQRRERAARKREENRSQLLKHFESSQVHEKGSCKNLKNDAVTIPPNVPNRKNKIRSGQRKLIRRTVTVDAIAADLQKRILQEHTYLSHKLPTKTDESNPQEDHHKHMVGIPGCEKCYALKLENAKLKLKMLTLMKQMADFRENTKPFLNADDSWMNENDLLSNSTSGQDYSGLNSLYLETHEPQYHSQKNAEGVSNILHFESGGLQDQARMDENGLSNSFQFEIGRAQDRPEMNSNEILNSFIFEIGGLQDHSDE